MSVTPHFKKKTTQYNPNQLLQGILQGNVVALSQAITLVESNAPKHTPIAQHLITQCLPHAQQSIRIGITGVPGVGKSTFIESFGRYLTSIGNKVAVLAVDPSSSLTHGSILGDKTRMEELVKDPNAFIRPTASGNTLGGVAKNTRSTIILCEAAKYNVILIETVGVGQSETMVKGMVDFFLFLSITGAGDQLQGIKRGIMEMADGILINKADTNNLQAAKIAQAELQKALHNFPQSTSGWQPKVLTHSSLDHTQAPQVWQMIQEYISTTQQNQYFTQNRIQQNQLWFMETIQNQLLKHFFSDPQNLEQINQQKQAIANNQIFPYNAAEQILNNYFKVSK